MRSHRIEEKPFKLKQIRAEINAIAWICRKIGTFLTRLGARLNRIAMRRAPVFTTTVMDGNGRVFNRVSKIAKL